MIVLNTNEHIVAEVHRHWLRFAGQGIACLTLALFPIAVHIFASSASVRIADIISDYSSHILLLECAWVLAIWIFFAVAWTNHYLDILIVTNQRVIDIEQFHLFSRDVSEVPLEQIEDIKVERHGILAEWLDFGTLSVQTAARSNEFTLHSLQRPEDAKNLIWKNVTDGRNN